jgi:excisionase family DNA binding protein
MTVAEIASVLKLNQQTIRNWIDAGKLPALHIGRRVRVKRSDFDRLLVDAEYANGESRAGKTIWDGEIPTPLVPGITNARAAQARAAGLR